MFPTLALLVGVVAPDPAPAEVPAELAEVTRFPWTGRQVRENRAAAFSHAAWMRQTVYAWNGSASAEVWEAECTWRYRCWDTLDDVVNYPSFTLRDRIDSLHCLRDLLGDEAFEAGLMPGPSCQYRTKP